ncbi:MAG: radical SAM protein [Acidobacteria bacterium]|nr:radical SAM protein [Acidobacteriota bacterium]
MSLNYLATHYRCSWPWNTAVMLCDGRLVCGCADPYGKRVLGDARTASVGDIWTGPTASTLRRELNAGGSEFCGDCPLKLPLAEDEMPPQRSLDAGPLPSRMYVECTAACNVSCLDSCCAPETGIARTRQAGMLDVDLFRRVLAEVGPTLERIDFFNYGEAFLHKRAVEMCELVKREYPHIYLYTSTNGGALNEESARRLVRSGIDEVTFSVDGASQDVYATYRQRGRFDHVMKNLRAVMDEKRALGTDVPFVNWRYILFTWNDNDTEMQRARALAAEIGVDRLCWEITDHPEHAFSRRFAPGTPDWARIRHQVWDDNHLGSAIPGTTPRARIEVRGPSRQDTLTHQAGVPLALDLRVRNLCQRPFPHTATYGRRLVRVGAKLLDADRELQDRDFARSSLPATVAPGGWQDLRMEIPALSPGHYHLKLDLVSEGVDWFESCGSEITLKALQVT